MRKMNKIVAIALAATMIIGSGVTAFAEGEPVTNGSTDGSGTPEGHVEKKLMNVMLPTIPSGQTPFAYTMDPERLIAATEAGKYTDATFPTGTDDKGIYFLTGEKTYSGTSKALEVINKSSDDIKLTVKVKTTATDGNTDIGMASAANVLNDASTQAPLLWLEATVGGEKQAITTTEATIAKRIPGVPGNFKVAVKSDKSGYEYVQKDSGLSAWKGIEMSVTGAVGEGAVTSTVTAPKMTVTWEYAELTAEEKAKTAEDSGYIAPYTTLKDTAETSAASSVAMATCSVKNGNINMRLVAGESAVADKLTSAKVNDVAKTATVLDSGAITITGGAPSAGTYNVVIVYDGVTYTGSVVVE